MTTGKRIPNHAIEPLILRRWSPRAFTDELIDEVTLMRIFEAARWAPSSYNSQPWRFVYAVRGSESWPRLLALLNDTNRVWAKRGAVLAVSVSSITMRPPGFDADIPSYSHSFDAGAAWAMLALQATALGWSAHAMVGFDKERASFELEIPPGYRVEAAIVIGKQGDRTTLPEVLQALETPNSRHPVSAFAYEGVFGASLREDAPGFR